jgi:hypothetical protein
MGAYALVEGKEVNGRGVWQLAGGKEVFIHYASTKQWWISNRADMEAGKARGYIRVASPALAPDQVTETWKVTDGTGTGTWLDAPKVRAMLCPMAAARQARDIRVQGQEQGDHQHDKMGAYALVEGKEVNGRGVWQLAGGGEEVFLYNNGGGYWFICDREDMEAGMNRAWLICESSALTPSALARGWCIVPGEAKGKCTDDAPKVRAMLCPMAAARGQAQQQAPVPPAPPASAGTVDVESMSVSQLRVLITSSGHPKGFTDCLEKSELRQRGREALKLSQGAQQQAQQQLLLQAEEKARKEKEEKARREEAERRRKEKATVADSVNKLDITRLQVVATYNTIPILVTGTSLQKPPWCYLFFLPHRNPWAT